ncbi:LCP family protein [Peribacillus acanthi]|uniref:LCP family protein n=1 Tax=Peribacillus acanthi TaxID=2171554 RepID=UPI000D3E6C0E|nr:LCP family protein [Peribacillus acanthi]
MRTQSRITQKKKKKRKKLLILVLTPILLLIAGATTYGAFLMKKAESVVEQSYEPLKKVKSEKREVVVNPKNDNTSILFIGIDDSGSRNYSESARSDALMLATFNEEDKSIKLLSIPRDSYVYIPDKGNRDKINHAHAIGGPDATIETVEELLDIPVDYYVRMNFYAFIDVVDALDGIEVEVPYNLSEKDTEDNRGAIRLQKGLQTLNGEEALALARTRKKDNDMERGKRQQEILKAIIKKGASVNALTKYTDVIEAVGDNMKTNLKFSEMKAFVGYAASTSGLDIETLQLAGTDSKIGGVYYYQLDEEALEQTKAILKTHLDLNNPEVAQENN